MTQTTHLIARRQPHPEPSATKRCGACRETLPLSAFPVRAKGGQGVAASCCRCVDLRYETESFACNRCSRIQPGRQFPKGVNGSAIRQPCKGCCSVASEAKTRQRRTDEGREPYHLLSGVDAERRTGVCRECGPTHVYATGAKSGRGWRCGKRSDVQSAEWYDAKAEIVDKHAARNWHRIRDVRGDEMRATCSLCGDVPVRWNSATGHFTCRGEARRARHAATERRRKLLLKYGLTPADYERMNEHQGGRCAICRGTDAGRSDSDAGLVVDHCHVTGRVRGLLCKPCNTGIGALRDEPDILIAAIAYLRVAAQS